MANEDIIIRNITKPSIKLDPIASVDRTSEGEYDKRETWDVDAKQNGYTRPFISINGLRIDNGLISFELDTNGFLPVCTFTFNMLESLFMSVTYPKDGDIVSVYIRAIGDVYKPIRMDFNILSVGGSPMRDSRGNTDGEEQTFTIVSECRIPGLYTQRIKAFREKTSYETLLEVSQDLGLGFSSNDKGLTDTMTWICPNFSYYDFIREVTDHSFKDDSSYFNVWVDLYYNLNFVNLGNQFKVNSITADTIKAAISGKTQVDLTDDGFPGVDLTFVDLPLILTNADDLSGTPIFINAYTLLSESGNNANLTGYISTIQLYDSESGDGEGGYVKYDIEATTTDNISETTYLQKGRGTENLYKEEKRSIWVGENKTGESAETHANYNHAQIQNEINLADSMKFNLNIEVFKFLPFLYKGQVIPVKILVKTKNLRKRNTGTRRDPGQENTGIAVIDNFLSGLYVITGFELVYNSTYGRIGQRLNLRKKTWTLNSSGSFPKYYPIETGVGDV